jgi:hypothetical protein
MSALDPFALGGQQDDAEGDALLIAAWRRYQELCRLITDEAMPDADRDALAATEEWEQVIEVINNTEPTTLAGCIAKLQYLGDPSGMEAGDRDDDVVSVRQVCAFLELSIPSVGGIKGKLK